MANLKELKNQINSVKGTQKTTKAMKLVSTAKLRRAEVALKNSKVYANKIEELVSSIASKISSMKDTIDNRAFKDIEVKKVDIIFVTADKGLCGGFNTQTIKRVKKLIETYKAKGSKIRLRAIGRKGIDYFKFNGVELTSEDIGVSSAPTYDKAKEFISTLVDEYVNGSTDKLILVHNGYVNIITQEIRESSLLPIDTTSMVDSSKSLSDLEIEPEDDDSLLEALITKYVEDSIYYALVDSLAAEHSSRMQAMDAATNNAKEMVADLNVEYNKARQQAITTELIEIISGVESMK